MQLGGNLTANLCGKWSYIREVVLEQQTELKWLELNGATNTPLFLSLEALWIPTNFKTLNVPMAITASLWKLILEVELSRKTCSLQTVVPTENVLECDFSVPPIATTQTPKETDKTV